MSGGPLVSVLVPTVDHGPTLRHSVASALAQELDGGLEVLIVGDGMAPQAAAVARELAAAEERVRLFEFPKGPRNGEVHRHAVLEDEARGRHVLYLSDDDLWMPRHAAMLVEALSEADFAAATAVNVDPEGRFTVLPHDLALPGYRALALSDRRHWNHMPLSVAAHTMDAYRRLDVGWDTSPEGIWSDLFFYRRFLAEDWVRAASVAEASCLVLPSPQRREMSPEQRAEELGRWAEQLRTLAGLAAVSVKIDAAYRAQAIGAELARQELHDWQLQQAAWIEEAQRYVTELEAELGEAHRRVAEIRSSRLGRLLDRRARR